MQELSDYSLGDHTHEMHDLDDDDVMTNEQENVQLIVNMEQQPMTGERMTAEMPSLKTT